MDSSEQLKLRSDEELLEGIQRGEREAFAVLVRRYEDAMYGYLKRYLGDEALAEDVFQNTFLQVFRKIDRYELGRPARPWLYTIATNQALDALRRRNRQAMASLDSETADNDRSLPQLLTLLETKQPSPLDAVEAEERGQLVRASVDRLPDYLKQVVILAYFQGLKYGEIAEIVDIPVGTVKSRLHSALAKLQEAWSTTPALPEG